MAMKAMAATRGLVRQLATRPDPGPGGDPANVVMLAVARGPCSSTTAMVLAITAILKEGLDHGRESNVVQGHGRDLWIGGIADTTRMELETLTRFTRTTIEKAVKWQRITVVTGNRTTMERNPSSNAPMDEKVVSENRLSKHFKFTLRHHTPYP